MLASPKRPPPTLFEPATPDRARLDDDDVGPPPSPPPLPVTTVDALSDDLLRHVFSFTGLLDSVVTVRRVCRRWRDAATPPAGRGALERVVVAREPRIAARLDADLLLRLIWLSSWPAPSAPRIPRWCDSYPSLSHLDVSHTAWRPSAGHPAPWPCLRRVLAACPGLQHVDATCVRVAGRPAPADGDEALLLAAAAAAHPRLRSLALDLSIRLTLDDSPPPPRPRRLPEAGVHNGAPPLPPPAAADAAPTPFDALLSGATPLRVATLTVTTPPTCWWYPERPALVARAAALGAAAADGGTVSRVVLTSLCADEAAAVAGTALASPSVTRLDVVGATGGDAAAGPGVAAAIAAASGLTHVHLVDQPLDEADAAALAQAFVACATLTHVSVDGGVTPGVASLLRGATAARAAAGGLPLTVSLYLKAEE